MSLLLVIINHAVTTNTKAPRWESQGYGGAGGTLWHWPTLVPHLHHGTWCPWLEVLLPAPTLPAGLVSGLSPGPHCCAAESTERMHRGLLERGGLKSGVQLVIIYCAFSAFFWSSVENGAASRLPAVFFITALVRHEHECEGSALKGELLWNMWQKQQSWKVHQNPCNLNLCYSTKGRSAPKRNCLICLWKNMYCSCFI